MTDATIDRQCIINNDKKCLYYFYKCSYFCKHILLLLQQQFATYYKIGMYNNMKIINSLAQKVLQQRQLSRQAISLASKHFSEFNYKRALPLLTGAFGVGLACNQYASRNLATAASNDTTNNMSKEYEKAASIYEFEVEDTFGNKVSLDKYKGHVLLIVNIASQCGLTKDNYKELTELKAKYHDKGLRILNFPCNQFGSQMPENDGESMVCHLRDAKADIGDVFKKVDVNGSNAAPIYQYLKAKQRGTLGSALKWNFTKFLVNKEGQPVNRYAPTTSPANIAKDIEKLL